MSVASSFVGRSTELDRLAEALEALERGEPRAVQVVGPAGIGKTRLLAELAAHAEDRGHIVLSGAGAELEQDLPFWVFVDALDEYVEGIEPRRLERLDEGSGRLSGRSCPRSARRRRPPIRLRWTCCTGLRRPVCSLPWQPDRRSCQGG